MREIRQITTVEAIIDIFADSDKYDYFENVPNNIYVLAKSIRDRDIDPTDLDLYHLQNEFDGLMVSRQEVDSGFESAYDFACWLYGSENVVEPE